MVTHMLRVLGFACLAALGMALPFLPGDFDPLALPLSVTLQLLILAAIPLTVIGSVWFVWGEVVGAGPAEGSARTSDERFALLSVGLAFTLGTIVAVLVTFAVSVALGILVFLAVTLLFIRYRMLRTGVRSENAQVRRMAFLYMVVLPFVLLMFQVTMAAPLRNWSRSHAVANARSLISDLRRYHEIYGRYPASLVAVWKDYRPDILGIDGFAYSPDGQSYNLIFEQPRLLCDDFGAREWVVYHPRDQHEIISHASWRLLLAPVDLTRNPGWFSVSELDDAHWKSFLFD